MIDLGGTGLWIGNGWDWDRVLGLGMNEWVDGSIILGWDMDGRYEVLFNNAKDEK